VLDLKNHDMNMHENLRAIKRSSRSFRENLDAYTKKYAVN
jgi:hypothetical protein